MYRNKTKVFLELGKTIDHVIFLILKKKGTPSANKNRYIFFFSRQTK